ncbi:MAG: ASCH domain-containing protein [Cyanobacteria bacterium J06621_8]
MSHQKSVEKFWQDYLDQLPSNHIHRFMDLPNAWSFGSGKEMANRLGKLVVKGLKTATCSYYLGTNLLEEAGVSIILNGSGESLCVIDTYEITLRQFQEIDEEWAKAEGEGDLSLEYWQNEHWKFFKREAEIEGYTLSKDMLLCCERFRLLYPSSHNMPNILKP